MSFHRMQGFDRYIEIYLKYKSYSFLFGFFLDTDRKLKQLLQIHQRAFMLALIQQLIVYILAIYLLSLV